MNSTESAHLDEQADGERRNVLASAHSPARERTFGQVLDKLEGVAPLGVEASGTRDEAPSAERLLDVIQHARCLHVGAHRDYEPVEWCLCRCDLCPGVPSRPPLERK